MTPNIVAVRNAPQVGRKIRRPSHTFQVRYRPWQVQPIMIAPVLPGETMKNLLLQARVVSDPVANPLIGWWTEYYMFYVKLRDLDDRDALTNMIVTNASTSALNSAADLDTYHAGDTINFTQKCLDKVVAEYFRDEDETVLQGAIDGLPVAQVGHPGWMDSAKDATLAGENEHEFPGQNPSLPAHMGAFTDHYAQWEAMRSMQLTAATFEDWLKTFGVSVPRAENEELHQPELIRYVREWTYPSNTINPADGMPSSALSWGIAERADKDRFFKEPGFLFGVTVSRPKVYFSKQVGSLTHYMNDAYAWLPAVLQGDPYTSLKKFTGGAGGVGPLAGNMTNDYWVDLRDLLVHGDQFVNFALNATDAGFVALPTAAMEKKYATAVMADALFKVPANGNKIKADGRIDLSILSRIEDTSG
ncbi:MAG: hypothetical protein E6R08_03520, partial [Nevskiaceae bacterium]